MIGELTRGLPEQVIPEWKAVCSSVGELQLFWRFHVRFCGNDENVALMRDILPFPFRIIRKAILFCVIMEIRKLMDPAESNGKINLSLDRLVQIVQPQISVELHKKLKGLRDEIHGHCQPILRWGNKRVGHADKKVFLGEDDEKLPEVDEHQFEKAVAMMRDLLREVHACIRGPEMPMHFPEPTGDADKLMDYIRRGHAAKQAEIAGMFP
jgi:hypothetical protein